MFHSAPITVKSDAGTVVLTCRADGLDASRAASPATALRLLCRVVGKVGCVVTRCEGLYGNSIESQESVRVCGTGPSRGWTCAHVSTHLASKLLMVKISLE